MTANELRQKYLDFFKEKGHAILSSAPLIPENDPTVLFTTAGMHPLVPYLLGERHPQGKRLASCQKCIRTGDIEDVGDNRHLTFFEMLGNWSLGDYFKKEAIEWSWEFLTDKKWLGLSPERIYVTVFAGDEKSGAEKDEISVGIWKEQYAKAGIEASVCELNEKAEKNSRIFLLGAEDNFWGPAGQTGPCGPCTEMFYDVRPEDGDLAGTHDDLVKNFRLIEIWNDVFMEFNKNAEGVYEKMDKQNVDTGMGVERTITVLNGKANVFETEIFESLIEKIEELSGKSYQENQKEIRIIADHLKAAVFILAEKLEPSNTEQGYVLRRLIRRAIRYARLMGIIGNFTGKIAEVVIGNFKEIYPELETNRKFIFDELEKEEERFGKTLEKGLKEYQNAKIKAQNDNAKIKIISGRLVFDLYQTYGFPLELVEELAVNDGLAVDKDGFQEEMKKHQDLSRTASAGKFKAGLADNSEQVTKYHTATHLLQAALRNILGEHVYQKGSNITAERMRFDFSHQEKMTPEQIKQAEDMVNEKIQEDLPVIVEEMSVEEAKKAGALGVFESKYGEKVKVYSIGDFSKEICGGPHVEKTGVLGNFKIIKEESSSSGVRRIKAVLE